MLVRRSWRNISDSKLIFKQVKAYTEHSGQPAQRGYRACAKAAVVVQCRESVLRCALHPAAGSPAAGSPAAGVRVGIGRLPEDEPWELEPERDRIGVRRRELRWTPSGAARWASRSGT